MTGYRDIAEAAGVSVSVVQRVFNGTYTGHRRDARERAERVRAVAAQLNYHPDGVARQLARGRSGAIGLCYAQRATGSLPGHLLDLLQILLDRFQAADYLGIPVGVHPDGSPPRALRERLFDSVIILDPLPQQATIRLMELAPIDCTLNTSIAGVPAVIRDEACAARQAMNALHAAGRRRFWYLGPTPQDTALEHPSVGARYRAVVAAARHWSLPLTTVAKAQDLPDLTPTDGVIAYSTWQAEEFLFVATQRWWRPGMTVGLACCDSTIRTHLSWPQLSRSWIDNTATAYAVAEFVLQRRANKSPPPLTAPIPVWIDGATA